MPNTKSTSASRSSKTTQRSHEQESALKELFVDQLKDILWAEKQLVKSLKKMSKAATAEELKSAFDTHLSETEMHVERVNQVFESIGERATAKKCEAMEGLVREAEELIDETNTGTEVRDVALIAAAQKVEHYEIATYGTLKTLAGVLGFIDAQNLLDQILQEEKNTDRLLTEIAEGYVNEAASTETK